MLLRFFHKLFVEYQTEEMEDWSLGDVLTFAREAGLSEKALKVLEEQEVTGKGLKMQNYEFFKDCGLPRGAISDLLLARDNFLHRMFTAIIDHVLLFCSCCFVL